jgi:putative transposase
LPVSPQVIGIDVGLSQFATLSTGEAISNPRLLKRDEADLKRMQRKLSQLDQGTPERHQAIKALNHVHLRIKNRRSDFAHKQSQQLINNYQIICFEDLDIEDMQHHGNKRINKSIAEVAWAQFVKMTTGKAEEAGRWVIKVDPRHTTQLCSGCGSMVKKDVSIRSNHCSHCGLILDRDHNAALNILARGLASIGSNP